MEIKLDSVVDAYDMLSQMIAYDYFDDVQLRTFILILEDTLKKITKTIDEWTEDIYKIDNSPHSMEQLTEIMESYFSLLRTQENMLNVIATLDARLSKRVPFGE